ncbi:hypothetical protein Hanom_Chr01g00040481 [Helianthus anomalus]
MKFSVAIFVLYNLLIIMAVTTVAEEEEEEKSVNEMCYYLKWTGPCLESKCSDACMRSGYSDGICRSDMMKNADPDACYCIGPC